VNSGKRRQTKEIFLSRMEQILPWQNMVEVIEPFYPLVMAEALSAGNHAAHSLHAALVQPERCMEDALYEIASMRLFARLSLDSALPDRTTIMNFRHLLSSINWPANCSRPSSLAGRSRRHDDQHRSMPPSLRHPA
jgi:IS5 family transposase